MYSLRSLAIFAFLILLLAPIVMVSPVASSPVGTIPLYLPLTSTSPDEDLFRHVAIYNIVRNFQKDLFVFRANGSEFRQLTNNGAVAEFAWSPDGNEVAYTTDTDDHLYLIRFDGTKLQQLTTTPGQKFEPRWSPDGNYLLYRNVVSNSIYQLNVVSREGGGEQAIGIPRSGIANQQWSPDSFHIAFTTQITVGEEADNQVIGIQRDGNNEVQLTHEPEGAFFNTWIEGGSSFVATLGYYPDTDIYRYLADGSDRKPIATSSGISQFYGVAPNQRDIVYAEAMPGEFRHSLFLQPAEQTTPTLLIANVLTTVLLYDGVSELAWSPSNHTLAVRTYKYTPATIDPTPLWTVPLYPTVIPPTVSISESLYDPYWVGGDRYIIALRTGFTGIPPEGVYNYPVLIDTLTNSQTDLHAVPGEIWFRGSWRYMH